MSRVHTQGSRPRAASRSLILFLRVIQVLLALGAVLLLGFSVFLFSGGAENLFAEAELAAPAPSTRELGFAVIMGALQAGAWIFVLEMLIRVARTVQQGDPFIDANISRLRLMWLVIAGSEIFRLIVHALANIDVRANSVTPAETGLDLHMSTIFLVIVIASLSEAFRHGVELRRDAELTI